MSKSYVDTLDTIAGALSGFESALNAHDKYGMMTGISQVISALGSSPLGLGGAALANLPAASGLAIATNAAAGMMVAGKMLSDFQRDGKISYSDAIALAGNLANLAAAVAISLNPYAKVGLLVTFGIATGLEAGYRTYKDYESVINDWFKDIPFTIDLPDDASDRKRANEKYNDSKNWQPPRDPLVLDLNGDDIKTPPVG